MYHFIPINGPLFRWAVPAHIIFRPSQSPFILGLFSSILLLTARYYHCLLVGQIQPWLQSARLWTVNMLGRFHSANKYGLLTLARYGRPMNGPFQL